MERTKQKRLRRLEGWARWRAMLEAAEPSARALGITADEMIAVAEDYLSEIHGMTREQLEDHLVWLRSVAHEHNMTFSDDDVACLRSLHGAQAPRDWEGS